MSHATPPPGQQPAPHQPAAAQPAPPGAMRIATVGGVPIHLSNSWPMGLLLLAFLYGSQLWSSGLEPLTVGLLTLMLVVMLVISVILHEGSHALTGKALGYDVRSITLSLWGGVTHSTNLNPTPLRSALMSLSGPLSNLALAAIAWSLDNSLMATGTPHLVLSTFWWMNLFLGIFNILPGLPMDGGGVVEAIVWGITKSRAKGTLAAAWGGRVVAIAVALWYLAPLLRGDTFDVGNVWMLLIAFFLWSGASASIKAAKMRGHFEAVTVASTSLPGTLLAATTPVAQLEETFRAGRVPILIDGTTLVGVVPRMPEDPDLYHLPASRFAIDCAPVPVPVTEAQSAADLVGVMEGAGVEVIIGRYPTGEPRVITAALLVRSLQEQATRAAGA